MSSQNGNYFSKKVPETGTPTASEPLCDAASGAPKDIFKDSNKDSSSRKIVKQYQDTEKAAAASAAGRNQDFSFPRIYKIYEQHFATDGRITGLEVEDLTDQFETYGGEWLLEAMREAVRHGKRTLAYINGVLNGYKARGGPHKEKPQQSAGGQTVYQVDDDDPITRMLREVNQANDSHGVP